MITANNPELKSWVDVPMHSDFPIQNLPFGVIAHDNEVCLATRIGDTVIDLFALGNAGMLEGLGFDTAVMAEPVWNDFIALGKDAWSALRGRLSELLRHDNGHLRDNENIRKNVLKSIDDVEMRMPVHVGDYTDFYSSREHATNVGIMFRGKENALMPNWLHLPVGYHGRASSIVVSGTPIKRPKGQMKPQDADKPVYGASKLLDFELEMAFVCGGPTEMGETIPIKKAEDYIFGMLLFNDWSARDIQAWEYVPLGPFLGKNFGSSVSPWIVSLDALEPFRVDSPDQSETEPLDYLKLDGKHSFDINLEAYIQPNGGEAHRVCRSNFKYMYWTMAQQLTHHTVNGCNIRPGDLCASGTISGPEEGSFGSMLEITWRGANPISMPDGSERKFIQDGDTVIMRGWSEANGVRIGFGEVSGKVLPAD